MSEANNHTGPSEGAPDENQYDIGGSGCLVFILIFISLIALFSCTRYAYYATETKITIQGQRIHMQELKKAKLIGDTTVTGVVITKRRVR